MDHTHGKHSKGKISYLESPERRKEFSPQQLLDKIPLKESANVLDFGAGTGYFTIPIAKRTKGSVYALDIDTAMLETIKEKALKEELTNIVPVQENIEESPFAVASMDVIIASLVLHEIQPLAPLLEKMKSILKQDGYFICLELQPKGRADKGPRMTMEVMESELKEAGFQITETYFPSESLYMFIARS